MLTGTYHHLLALVGITDLQINYIAIAAGLQDNLYIEMYNQGSITTLTNDCLSQASYEKGPGIGACKIDQNQVALIGGEKIQLFFIHDVSTGLCKRKKGRD